MGKIKIVGGKSFRDEIKSSYAWPRAKWKPGNVYHSPIINIAFEVDEKGDKHFYEFRDAGDVLVEKVLGTPVWSDLTEGTKGGYKLDENMYAFNELMKAAKAIIAGSFQADLAQNFVNYLNNWAQHYSTPDVNFMDKYVIPIREVKTIEAFKATPEETIRRVVFEMNKDWSLNNCELMVLHTRTMSTDIPGIAWRKGSIPNEEEDNNELYDKCNAIQRLAGILELHNYLEDPASANMRNVPHDSKDFRDAFKKWKFEYDKHRVLWSSPFEESMLLYMWCPCDLDMKFDTPDSSTKKVEWLCCAGSYSGNKLDKANASRRKGKAGYNPSYTNICLNYSTGDTVSLAGQNLSFDPFQGPDDNYEDVPATLIHKFESEIFADKAGRKLNSLAPIKFEACVQDFRTYLQSLDLSWMTPEDIKNCKYAFQLLGVVPPATTSLDEPASATTAPTVNPMATPTATPVAQTPTATPTATPVAQTPVSGTSTAQPVATPTSQPVAQSAQTPTPNTMGGTAMPTAKPVGA